MAEMAGTGGFIGEGDVLIDILDENFQSTGFFPPVNATDFEITAKSGTEVERKSRMRATYNTILDSDSSSEPHELKIVFDNAAMHILALAFSATVEAFTQTSGTAVPGTSIARLDKWVELGSLDVSAVVVKDLTDTTTYVLDTDYEIEPEMGMIRALTGGAITEGQMLNTTLNRTAISGQTLLAQTQSSIYATIKLNGYNRITKKRGIGIAHRVRLNSDTVMNFLADKFATIPLKGKPLLIAGKKSAWEWTSFD